MYLSSVTGLGIKTTDDSESMENLHNIRDRSLGGHCLLSRTNQIQVVAWIE